MSPLIIVLIIVVVLIGWVVMAYNGLVSLVNLTKNAWADIDVQMKRRADLIPNLVETVKGYAKHEKNVFENVTKARSALMTAKGPAETAVADNMMTGALKSLFAVAENYPTLKASENFSQLQADLTDTENKIESSRRFYNANVRDLNTKIQMFPTNILANMFGFKQQEFFQTDEVSRQPVKVNFSS